MATIPEALAQAVAYHGAGQLQAAEQIYCQILQADSYHADAWHLLGVLAHQVAQHGVAIEYIGRAISLAPDVAVYHCNLGEVYRSLSRVQEAEASYRRAVELKPDLTEAHNNLGSALRDQQKLEEAAASYERAATLNPAYAEAWSNLGTVWREQGKLDEAVSSCRRAIDLKPELAEAHNALGIALREQKLLEEAAQSCRRALDLRPEFAEAHCNLGIILKDQGKPLEAIACYRRALELKPKFFEAHSNLGNALREQGQLDDAIACYRRVLDLKPDLAEVQNNLGNALQDQGKVQEAISCYRRALDLKPGYAEALSNLGTALLDEGELDEALQCCRLALHLKPALAEAYCCLGNVLKDMGLLDEAIAAFRQGLNHLPDSGPLHSNLVFTLHLHPDADGRMLGEELRRWNERHAEPLAAFIRPHTNDRDPERRLRVGFVSADYRNHPVGRFLLPLLERRDPSQMETFCYASVTVPDAVTRRLRRHADCWRDVAGMSDERLSELVGADGIDILVDLAAHTAYNRLLVFARKPAPIQATYLAYCSSTGMRTMDYRLTDPFFDPPGLREAYYSEESVWLPETYWCYRPLLDLAPAGPAPALTRGAVTFGCLNNFCKVTVPSLAMWCQLLQRVPGSRLLLHAHVGAHRDRIRAFFAERAIAPERVDFVGFVPFPEYLRLHDRIDVCLDPFPYNGGTTTCDALWMGVPVISLAGENTATSRAGLSILSNAGLSELVAHSPEEYVQKAAELSTDLRRLAELRATLRERMQASPLMDAPRFARNVEAAFRTMWQRWCDAPDVSAEAGSDSQGRR